MAFEQFFYNGNVSLTIRANADCSCKLRLDDGNTAFIDSDNIFRLLTIITEIPKGGIVVNGSGAPHMRFTPVVSGGMIAGGHAFSTEERPASGGVLVGGNAFFQEKDEEIGSGGILVGGENFWSDAQAGILIGGQAIPQIAVNPVGGSISGGTATIDAIYTIADVAGGVLVDGDAHNIENITIGDGGVLVGGANESAETAYGGVLTGGRATTSYDEIGIGGVIAGGIAPNGTHDFGTGGVLVDGSIIQRITQHIDGSGLLAGGKAAEEPPTAGGVLFGGGIFQTFDETSAGGLIANGRAHVEITPFISGSVLLGGLSIVGIQPGVFGGTLFGGGLFQTFDESGLGGAVVDGHGIDTQSAYHYISDGDFVQVTQPDPNIYKITTAHFNYTVDEATAGVTVVGNATVGRRFFGQSLPTFAFGKTRVKNEACRSFREIIRQPTVLAMTRTETREWLEKLDLADWSITSFDPKKREVCILVEAGFGITHLVTAELLLIGSGVGSP